MILGVGIDIVEIDRFDRAVTRSGERLLARIFTEAERRYCESRSRRAIEHFAARFAAKEAVMKALGTGWAEGIQWVDIEVVHGDRGAPGIDLHRAALERFRALGADRIFLSISHTSRSALAQAILETDAPDRRPPEEL